IAGEQAIGNTRLAAEDLRLELLLRRTIDVGRTLSEERIVSFAQKAGVGTRVANGRAPAQVAGQVDVCGQLAALLEILADGAHARRIGVLGRRDVTKG